MPHINYDNKEINFKIVYYGPGMSGKTTNLVHIHKMLQPDHRGEMVVLDTDEERTLFFDFFPLSLGRIEGFFVRFNMYTVPGQIYYEASRRLILEGADGVVFVVDSNPHRLPDNIMSYGMMQDSLGTYDIDMQQFPLVLQYNKRDCQNPIPIGTIEKEFKLDGIPVTESIATQGAGVMETIRLATSGIINQFKI